MDRSSMTTAGVIAFRDNSRTKAALAALHKWSKKNNIELIYHPNTPDFPELSQISQERASLQRLRDECQWAVSIGGDGTFLTAARAFAGLDTPILGVHTGKTGFLTDFPAETLEESLHKLWDGEFEAKSRMMLDVNWSSSEQPKKNFALNEILVRPDDPEQMVQLDVTINGRWLTNYLCDFLLISTPTGSTAYNLSAGGPIVHPTAEAVVLTAVNPPSLSVRPLVIPATAQVHIKPTGGQKCQVILDGKIRHPLEPSEDLTLTRSQMKANFFKSNSYGFVDALRDKLGWCGHFRDTRGKD